MSKTITFKNTPQLLHYAYYKLYPKIVYDLITTKRASPRWINPSKDEEYWVDDILVASHLAVSSFTINGLVNSINRIGMIFPFIGTKRQVCLGKHRWYALRAKNVNKKFLGLFWDEESVYSGEAVEVPVINFEKNTISFVISKERNIVCRGF